METKKHVTKKKKSVSTKIKKKMNTYIYIYVLYVFICILYFIADPLILFYFLYIYPEIN